MTQNKSPINNTEGAEDKSTPPIVNPHPRPFNGSSVKEGGLKDKSTSLANVINSRIPTSVVWVDSKGKPKP